MPKMFELQVTQYCQEFGKFLTLTVISPAHLTFPAHLRTFERDAQLDRKYALPVPDLPYIDLMSYSTSHPIATFLHCLFARRCQSNIQITKALYNNLPV